jgi:transcriptional regulator with XRE-family HTH domain
MSTQKDTLATDNVHEPGDDLGMALYLAEWLTFKGIEGAELARRIGCSRSLVSKWVTKQRALRDVNWITKICRVLGITQEQLSKMPPKSHGSLGISSETESDTEGAAGRSASGEGIEMIEKRIKLHESVELIPDDLLDTANSLLERLNALGAKRKNP